MIPIRSIVSILSSLFRRERSIPLARPKGIEWNSSLSPRTIQVKGHTIFYTVKGEGSPLLFIHGYGAGIWVWEKQIDFFSRFNQVFALDLIGHGFSDRPRIEYTPETYIHFTKDFMDGIGIEKASLIGNSMGGGIAWALAGLFPERVERLVLIDSAPPDVLDRVENESFKTLVAIKDIPLLPYLAIASRNRKAIQEVLDECVYDKNLVTPAVLDRQYRLTQIRGTTWVLYSTFKNGKEASRLKEILSRIHQPTLILWGEEDPIFPLTVGERLHQSIPGSIFKKIEKTAHIPMWETPDEVNSAILSFLRG